MHEDCRVTHHLISNTYTLYELSFWIVVCAKIHLSPRSLDPCCQTVISDRFVLRRMFKAPMCLPCMWYQNCKHAGSFGINQSLMSRARSPEDRCEASIKMYIPKILQNCWTVFDMASDEDTTMQKEDNSLFCSIQVSVFKSEWFHSSSYRVTDSSPRFYSRFSILCLLSDCLFPVTRYSITRHRHLCQFKNLKLTQVEGKIIFHYR